MLVASSPTAWAEDPPATLTVVHGIAGTDLGLSPDLPVDAYVAELDACVLTGFAFGDISARLALPAGTYTIEVRLADAAAGDCGGPAAIGPAAISLEAGENATVVAHLTEDGAPTASKYTNRVSPAAADGDARVAVHHNAAVGAVDVRLYPAFAKNRFRASVDLRGVTNPQSADADVRKGLYLATISPAGGRPVAYDFLVLPAGQTTLLYAVGSLANGTFELIRDEQALEIPDPGEGAPAVLTVIHGIPGDDLGLDSELPVDVYVEELDACVLTDFRFGEVSPRLALPAGTYTVEVHLVDPDAGPCGGPTAIGPAPIPLDAGENASVVAHLTDAGAPTASRFTNDLSRTARARIALHHVAAAPAVDVSLSRRIWFWTLRLLQLDGVTNGGQASRDVLGGGLYRLGIAPAGEREIFAQTIPAPKGESTLVYAVGSVENGTFQLIVDRQDLD
jgi:hypothetical protein